MFTRWNILFLFLLGLSRHVRAFWPLTTTKEPCGRISQQQEVKNIAIIGAGAGGSSTAYYLQQFAAKAGITVNITIFERNSYIGGRTTTVNAYDSPLEPVELGASIFVDLNEILKNASDALGLNAQNSISTKEDILGIWNGKKFVFVEQDTTWQYWDLVKLFWKYGLAPYRTEKLMQSTLGKFRKLYQAPFFPFRSLTSRIYDLELESVTGVTGAELLAKHHIGTSFASEIVQASTRVNYGQNLNLIHGLESMVCMVSEGAVSIPGGNWQIFDRMVDAANATILLNTAVRNISKTTKGYNIEASRDTMCGKAITISQPFDTVVLASPLQFSNISVEEGLLKHTPEVIPYVQLHVTLFTSPHRLNPGFFNLAPCDHVPTTIITTLPPEELPTRPEQVPAEREKGVGSPGFFSISTLRPIMNPVNLQKEYLYKIFSPQALNATFLSSLLNTNISANLSTSTETISWYYPHIWQSYPYEFPRVKFEEAELARGFWYTSGMESFISTMETNALMGMNIARLITDDYLEIQDSNKPSSDAEWSQPVEAQKPFATQL